MSEKASPRAAELGRFLRARREALPAPSRRRARTPGQRREDIAAQCSISVDYYTRLEQGRTASMPSASVTEALATALSLSLAEVAHLHRLTGRAVPEPPDEETPASSLLFLLQHLGRTPAQIVDDLGVVLAQNPAADALFPWIVDQGIRTANVYERWFCHEDVRAAFPVDLRSDYSKAQAGELRAAATRRTLAGDERGNELVAELAHRSAEFRRAWEAYRIHDRRDKRLWMPSAGGGGLLAHVTVDDRSSQRLVAFESVTQEGDAR